MTNFAINNLIIAAFSGAGCRHLVFAHGVCVGMREFIYRLWSSAYLFMTNFAADNFVIAALGGAGCRDFVFVHGIGRGMREFIYRLWSSTYLFMTNFAIDNLVIDAFCSAGCGLFVFAHGVWRSVTCGRYLKLRNGGFVIAFGIGEIFAAVSAIPIFGVPILRAGSSLSSNVVNNVLMTGTSSLFSFMTFASCAGRKSQSEADRRRKYK